MASENEYPKADGDVHYGSEQNHQSGNFITVEAGETLAAGDVVFIYMSGHANEGEAWLADANVQDKCRSNGIVVTGGDFNTDSPIKLAGEDFSDVDISKNYLHAYNGGLTCAWSDKSVLNIIEED